MARLAEVSAKSPLAEAIRYTLGHWDGLTVFLDDGRVEVDSNTVERTIRPIALGRKNALFAGSTGGGQSWAVLASLINTAKLHQSRSTNLPRRCAGADRLRPDQDKCLARAAALDLEGGAGPGRRCRMTRPRRRSARPADTAMNLEKLEAWLDRVDPQPRVDGVSMLDGYLTAIVIGPCSIPPDEWFADLLGPNGHIGSANGERLAAIMAIVARFNVISEGLSTAPKHHAPIFERRDDGTVSGRALVHGISRRHAAAPRRLAAAAPISIGSSTVCCCRSCSTAPITSGAQCSGHPAWGPKPSSSSAPPITISPRAPRNQAILDASTSPGSLTVAGPDAPSSVGCSQRLRSSIGWRRGASP